MSGGGGARLDVGRRTERLGREVGFITAARLVTNTGYRFLYPFLPVVARALGVSLERAGLLLTGMSLASVSAPIVASVNARHGERHRRLVLGALAAFSVATAVAASSGAYVGVLVGFVLLGAAKPAFDVGALAYLSERTPYQRRARVLAITELTWAGALLVAAPLAGWLIDRAGWQAPLWALCALGATAVAVGAVLLQRDDHAAATEHGRLRLDRSSLALLAVMSLFTFGAEVTFVVFGAWLERDFGLSVVALGGVSTLIGVAELAGSGAVVLFGDRLGKRRSVAFGLVVAAVGFGLLPLTGALATGLAALAVALLGFEFTIVAAIPLASEALPQARSRYLALVVLAMAIPRGVAAAVAPALFTDVGLWANGALSVAANLAALLLLLALVEERHTTPP